MIKKLLLTTTLFIWILSVWGQNQRVLTDSLLLKLDRCRNEEKAGLLNQIAQSYMPGAPIKCIEFAEKALNMAKRQRDDEQIAIANKNIGAAYYNLYKFDKALEAYENATDIFKKLGKKPQLAAVYINIGLVYRDISKYEDATKAYATALEIYKSANDQTGTANVYNMIGSLANRQGNFEQALNNYLEALKIRETLKVPANIAASCTNVSLAYRALSQYDKAIEYGLKALEIRKKLNTPSPIATALNAIGSIYWDKKNWDKALEYYFLSIKVRYETGEKVEIANSYQNIGNLYKDLGNLNKARDYCTLALAIYYESNDNGKIALTLTTLGNLETLANKPDEALNYFKQALEIRKKAGEKKDIAASYNNLGKAYSELEQNGKASENLNEALKIRKVINDIPGQIITENELGNLYQKTENIDKAQISFEHAFTLALNSSDTYHIGLCSRKLAEILIPKKQTDKALELLQKSHEAAEKIKNAELNKNAHLAYYKLYNSQKDYQKALEHYQQYAQINDSVQSAQNSLKVLGIQQNLELEKKSHDLKNIETEVKVLRQEKDLQRMALTRERNLVVILIIILVFAGVIGGLFYNRYQIRKKHNAELKDQNQIIENANIQLKQSEAELTLLNATKDKFFAIIAHDIKNPLSSLLNLSQIIIEKADHIKEEDTLRFNEMIYESASNLNNLLENLLTWARSNTNKMRFYPLPLKLAPIVHNIILLNKITSLNKKIEIENNVPEDIEVYADQQMLTSILRNLISNSLKFTPEGGTISISAKDHYRDVEIFVKDTGQGISTENINKLFRIDTHFTTIGTSNEAGTGLGLVLTKEFIEKNDGKISVISQLGQGSTFAFTLPTGKD